MRKLRPINFLLALALALFAIMPAAAAVPPTPATFWGTVTIDGANAPDGTTITVWINGVQYAETTTFTNSGVSYYTVDVPGDDPDTTGVLEGGVTGDSIVFQVDGQDASESGSWSSGTQEVNLTATGSTQPATPTPNNPTPTATAPTPTPPPEGDIIDDDSGQATLFFRGSRTIEMEDIIFSEINPNGEDFIATVATDDQQPWIATHTAANNGGWHVTLRATGDFSNGAGHSIALDTGDGFNGFTVMLPDDNLTGRSGSNSNPLSQALTKQIVSTTGISILSAATGTGEGIYDFIPQFELFIPGTTLGGNYSTTVEVKMVFGP